MKHFTVGRVALALLATVVVGLSQAAVAFAGGGNSANAKLCQKGGWQTLFRSDGSSFADQGACVSYGAQGGTLTHETKSQIDCQSFGGTYATGTANVAWTCNGWTGDFGENQYTLAVDCFADGGGAFGSGAGPPVDSTCLK